MLRRGQTRRASVGCAAVRIGSGRRFSVKRGSVILGGLFAGQLTQSLFFLLALLLQISLTLLERIIWFCQNDIPAGTKAE